MIKPTSVRSCVLALAAACLHAWPLAAVEVVIGNAGFETDVNASSTGVFGSGDRAAIPSVLSGWTVIAADNASADNKEVAVGWANIAPAQGAQVVSLMAGAAIGQLSGIAWSSLAPGDKLTLTVAAGDRNVNAPSGNPRWADNSFFGLSDGLAMRLGPPPTTPSNSSSTPSPWIGKQVAWKSVPIPPGGHKSGTMGDVTLIHTVTADDVLRSGDVGVFIASLGHRDETGNGTSAAGVQSFWDHVRLELAATPGPTVQSFTADPPVVAAGSAVTLSWTVANADQVTISPEIGQVAASGSVQVNPNSSRTYTLTATNADGIRERSLTIVVTAPALYRYFRFTPTKLRNDAANSVQLAEFQMLLDGAPVAGAVATNPGGSSPGGEGPGQAVDGSLNTKWLDFNKGPLVLDYGAVVVATGYRFATANDVPERDPISWTVEGSFNGTYWSLVDQRQNQPVPTARKTWIGELPTLGNAHYPDVPGAPRIVSFQTSPAAITEGDQSTLSWSVTGADKIYVTGIGEVAASGSLLLRPPSSVGFTLVAINSAGASFASAGVSVEMLPRGSMIASFADAEFHTTFDGAVVAGPTGAAATILDVGRFFGESILRHMVIPFQLPADLGPGGFRSARLMIYPLRGDLGADGRTPINLFAIPGARVSAIPLASDVNDGVDNHLQRGYLIQYGLLDEATPLDDSGVASGPGPMADGLGYWLNEAYAGGANAGKFVFLRLSPDALEIPDGFGFGVSAGDAIEEFAPTLDYIFDPDGVPATPVVGLFQVAPGLVEAGDPATLLWNVFGADSVTISPGIGAVAASGSLVLQPAATTTFTITASNAAGTRSEETDVRVVPPGSYRWYRLVTVATRSDPQALGLSEFQLLAGGQLIGGATATSPGSDSLIGIPNDLVDGSLGSHWFDIKRAPILFDYGTFVAADSYRLGTGNMGSAWDPSWWRLEASRDGINWLVIDEQISRQLPLERGVFSESFTLVDLPPPDDFRVTSVTLIENGGKVRLVWNSQPGASYRIERSATLGVDSWIPIAVGVPSGGLATTHELERDGAPIQFYQIMKE